ncbi:MAG: hypothetical protein WDM85_17125 [Caulobacteraceae bacterium]
MLFPRWRGEVSQASRKAAMRDEGGSALDLPTVTGAQFRQTGGNRAMTPDDLMFKPGLMKGHRILITGGGTGLGKEMAEGCLILGAEVYICGRRGAVLKRPPRS